MTYKVAVNTLNGSLSESARESINDKLDDLAGRYPRLRAIELNLDMDHEDGPLVDVQAFIGTEDKDAAFVCAESANSVADALAAALQRVERKLRDDISQQKEKLGERIPRARRPLWIGGAAVLVMLALLIVIRLGFAPDTGRLAIYGMVSFDGRPVEHGSVSFLPSSGHKGPAANTHIAAGRYRFTKTNGPTPGEHEVTVSVAPDPAAIWRGFSKRRGDQEQDTEITEAAANNSLEPSLYKTTMTLQQSDSRKKDLAVPFP